MAALPKTITGAQVRQPAQAATRTGYGLVAGFIAALLLFTAVPYIYGYASAPAGRVFQGIVFDVPDVAQYWSWMRDHRSALLVANRMTSEPNEPAFFNLLWLLLGTIERVSGLSEAAMFQIMRVVGGATFLALLWWFIGLFIVAQRMRWTAYIVAALGGGFGMVWVIEKYARHLSDVRFPLDVYVAEPNTFFALLAQPHFLTAAALVLGCFGCFLAAERNDDRARSYAWATLWAFLLGLSHAYDLLTVYAVLGSYVLLQSVRARRILWPRWLGLAAVGLISFPPAGYFAVLTSRNPIWREVLSQFNNAGVFTPNLLHLPILLGLPFVATLVFGAALLYQKIRARNDEPRTATIYADAARFTVRGADFLWVWAVVGFFLLYIPTDFQIHMLNPYQVPLAILATVGLYRWLATRQTTPNDQSPITNSQFPIPNARPSPAARFASVAVVLFVAATLPTNLYLWSWRILDLRRAETPFYLASDEVSALHWLDARSDERAVVLSSLEFGHYIPALTGQRALLSHWAQTVRFFEKRDAVQAFFDPATPAAARKDLLDRYGVRYIVYGPQERALGAFDPTRDPTMHPVFQSRDVAIFEVRGIQ